LDQFNLATPIAMAKLYTITNAILAAVAAEIMVLGFAAIIPNDKSMFWQYAARYSARVSFLIFALVLLYTAIYGLLAINKDERKRKIFRALIYFFWANHIIHLVYLSANQAARNIALIKPANIAGIISYIIVLLLPLILNRSSSGKRQQTVLLLSLVVISSFFLKVYFGRLLHASPVPDASPEWLYGLFAAILALLVLAILYRHISDSRIARIST
jgi:hypothetical protein